MEKSRSKKITVIVIVSVVLIFLCFLAPFAAVGLILPAQFDKTYYGELSPMFRKLYETEGKKIVFIGNSAVAFGVRSDLIDEEIEGYTAVNFGLYGSLGTKMMLDLSEDALSEGDVVVIMPEPYEQPQSLYFSASEAWNAIDGDTAILNKIKWDHLPQMVGAYAGYTAKRYASLVGEKPEGEGVYARSSFNDDCVMTYPRAYNQMPGGYDADSMINPSVSLFGEGFADYINDYYQKARAKGASVYFGFCPMNASALEPVNFSLYYTHLTEELEFPVLGNPNNYVYARDWFYNSNVHVNDAGAVLYTRQLIVDLKTILGDRTPLSLPYPEKPAPQESEVVSGNDKDANCFLYALDGDGNCYITGLSEEGKNRTSLTVPAQHDGKAVRWFDAEVFAGNTTIEKIVIQKNISVIRSYSFAGCSSLAEIVLVQDSPSSCPVTHFTFDGVSPVIYVPKGCLAAFVNDYTWSYYGELIREAEE